MVRKFCTKESLKYARIFGEMRGNQRNTKLERLFRKAKRKSSYQVKEYERGDMKGIQCHKMVILTAELAVSS